MWKPGDRLTHRHSPELGLGRVVAVEGRSVVVEFTKRETVLRLAATSDALVPVQVRPGQRVRLAATGKDAVVEAELPDGRLRLVGGGEVGTGEAWPLDLEGALLERLAQGDVDPVEDLATRLDALHLAALREAGGLESFLGGRIRLFPHQLHVAERATRADPVRWLLADEVGLGKTVEACLVLNHLVRARGVERCLIVAPATLTVQWLGELWRKHHQVFVLLDDDRLADVVRDHGRDFNPFDAHRQAVVALETLIEHPRLTEHAVRAGIELLIVDEAHHLRRPPGHPGDAAWRAVAPIAGLGRHTLLLTATPLEDDAHGFFRLLQLLRPDELPEGEDFQARLAQRRPLPPCTSSTRRDDIGGLPPRVAHGVPLDAAAWRPRAELESALRAEPPRHAVARRRQADRLCRVLASGAALGAVLGPHESGLRQQAEQADRGDPRVVWLAKHARAWRDAGEKSLVFVAHRETLELLRTELSRRAQLASAVFHEDLSPARRDIEVGRFRLADGPSLLVSTECGGEGRNFEFCRRLVLFDLPWNPMLVEQRIGRLDRIGRRVPVEIVFFEPPGGIAAEVARVHQALGVFREPLAGLEPDLAPVADALEALAAGTDDRLPDREFAALMGRTGAARSRIRDAAYRELHRDPYRPERADSILSRVPAELEALTEDVVVASCERLGLHVERHETRRACSIELGNEALVDSLPGVPGGASFLGTFDREAAVADEALDFFASGHPLVEGLLAHLAEAPLGRVAALGVSFGDEHDVGLLALYRDGPGFEAVALDGLGGRRPDWAAMLRRRPLRTRRVPAERLSDPTWAATIRRLARSLDPGRRPEAVAGLLVSPTGSAD